MSDWPSDGWQEPPPPAPPPGLPPPMTPPPGSQPQWGTPGSWTGPQQPPNYQGARPNNGLAIASLIAGCAQFVCWGIGSILAIVFGHIARGQIRRSNGTQGGSGLATAGLVLGYVGLGLTVLGVVVIILVFTVFGDDIEQASLRDDARDLVVDANRLSEGGSTPRDPSALQTAYVLSGYIGNDDYSMHLADGTPIETADVGDWERNGWRVELQSDVFLDTAYVCAEVPAAAGIRPALTNGRCDP